MKLYQVPPLIAKWEPNMGVKVEDWGLTSSPPYFVEGGDSKDRSLGFLFPRPDLRKTDENQMGYLQYSS